MNVWVVCNTFKMVMECVGRCACRKMYTFRCLLFHTSKSPRFLLVLEKRGVSIKSKLRSDTMRNEWSLWKAPDRRVRWQRHERALLTVQGECRSLPARLAQASPVRLSLSLIPCPVLPAGQWDSGPLPARDRGTLSKCLPGRSCTETGAWRFSPNPPSSSRVSGPRPAAGRRWLDVRFRFPSIGLACSPERWERRRLRRPEPGGSRRPGTQGCEARTGGAPTHVALQLPLGGRLDEPARAHGVARAHRGRRRCFLQLGRPPVAGGSRARDAGGAGPAPPAQRRPEQPLRPP